MTNKYYQVEPDIIASAGPEGVTTLASSDNEVKVDFEEIERRSRDSKDHHRFEYSEFLRWTNGLMTESSFEEKCVMTPAGGKISWGESNKIELEHITTCPIRTSELKRAGKKVSFPEFLRYQFEPLKSGIVKLESFCGNPADANEVKFALDEKEIEIFPNQFVIVNEGIVYSVRQKLKSNSGKTRFSLDGEPELHRFERDSQTHSKLPDFKARNLEQRLGFDQLTSPDTEICFITGGSGSGKTVVAYAAAIDLILGTKQERMAGETYDGIVLFKSIDIIGGKHREMGFLPGTALEKTEEFMKSYKDAHRLLGIPLPFIQMLLLPYPDELFPGSGSRIKDSKIGNFYLPPRNPAIEIEHLQFARGRTFEGKIIFVDETQNYSPFEIKQLLERVGIGSKIFLVGDPEQVDNPHLTPDFNGLVYAANTLRSGNHPRVSFMHFDKNYRCQTAELSLQRRAPRLY